MDTTISLRATGSGDNAQKAVDESFTRIAELDKLASSQNADSDVSKINAAAGKDYVQVDPAIYEMLEYSKNYSAKSNGEWDITVGIIMKMWDIGNADQHVPPQEDIQAALKLVNYKDILLRPEDHSVMLAKPGMAIDLGGVAKGYAVDEIRKIYNKYGIKQGLINMGSSSMYAAGTNSKGTAWNIGIKHPRSEAKDNYLGIVSIQDEFLSTSGDYERFFIQNGKRYHHIFDPRTGYPADSGVMMVTTASSAPVRNGLRLRFSIGRPRNAIWDGTMSPYVAYSAVAISETGVQRSEWLGSGRLLDQLRLAARESSQMAMAANTMVSTPSTMSVGSITMRQCIIAPLQMPIRKVGTASSSSALAAAAILRPMRICGATNKATTPNTRMTTPMPVAACCE